MARYLHDLQLSIQNVLQVHTISSVMDAQLNAKAFEKMLNRQRITTGRVGPYTPAAPSRVT